MNSEITCYIFDVDGTLVNTTEFICQAFEHTLAFHGLPLPARNALLRKIGKPLEEDYRSITGLNDTSHLCETHRAFQNENQHLVQLFPGVEETLMSLKGDGSRLVAATARSKITSLKSLQQVGIESLFDLVLSAEDAKPKPHPECVLKTLKHFYISHFGVLMIGDRKVDIETGKNAGVKTVGVTYGFSSRDEMVAAKPDYMIDDIRKLRAAVYA